MKKNKLREAIDAGVKGFKESFKPGVYQAGGERVICPHCKCDQFDKQAVVAPLGGKALVCTRCEMILWFRKSPQKMV